MNHLNRFASVLIVFFLMCSASIIKDVPQAQAEAYSHFSPGVCSHFLDDLSREERRKYAQMHATHLAEMKFLYRQYTNNQEKIATLEHSKYYGYGNAKLKKQELKPYLAEKKELEKVIEKREHEFAKKVHAVFGKKLKVSGRHVIRHGEGRGSVCGFVTVF